MEGGGGGVVDGRGGEGGGGGELPGSSFLEEDALTLSYLFSSLRGERRGRGGRERERERGRE